MVNYWVKLINLLLIEIFAEVAKVNTEALENPASFSRNIAEKKPRQNVFSYSYLGILICRSKKCRNSKADMLSFPMLKEDHATIQLNSCWLQSNCYHSSTSHFCHFCYNLTKIRIEMTSNLHSPKNVGFLPVSWLNN